MYALDIKPEADKIFRKLEKKNKKQLMIINKKILEVLVFKIDHKREIVDIYYYDHHDRVYLWRPKY